jgi:hypothetical protein
VSNQDCFWSSSVSEFDFADIVLLLFPPETMYMDHNKFAGSIPDSLYELTALVDLRIGFNELTGTLSRNLGQLSKLGK